MKTIRLYWKQLLVCALVSWGFSFASDIITDLSVTPDGDHPGLANLVNNLQGFANYIGAHAAVTIIGLALGWPTVGRFDLPEEEPKNSDSPGLLASKLGSFDKAWASLTDKERLYILVAVCIGEVIAAAICFS